MYKSCFFCFSFLAKDIVSSSKPSMEAIIAAFFANCDYLQYLIIKGKWRKTTLQDPRSWPAFKSIRSLPGNDFVQYFCVAKLLRNFFLYSKIKILHSSP